MHIRIHFNKVESSIFHPTLCCCYIEKIKIKDELKHIGIYFQKQKPHTQKRGYFDILPNLCGNQFKALVRLFIILYKINGGNTTFTLKYIIY